MIKRTAVQTALLSFLLPIPFSFAADVPTRGSVVNIVEWDGGQLPPVYERSSQLPLTMEDIIQLSRSDFSPGAVARMIQERRYAGDASANALIEMRSAGVAPNVLQAISLHALTPNLRLHLSIQVSFEGTSSQARRRYLYVLIPDGEIERVFTADLATLLSGHWQRDVQLDLSDPVLPKQVRQLTFSGSVPLKRYGQKRIRVLTSSKPDVYNSGDIPDSEKDSVQIHLIDYPSSSLRQECRLFVRFRQDRVIPYKWEMGGSYVECEWN